MAREKNPKTPPREKPLHPVECEKRTGHRTSRTVARRELTMSDYPFMSYEWIVCPTCGVQFVKVRVMTEGGPRNMVIRHAVVSNSILEDMGRHVDWMSGNRREEDEEMVDSHDS